MFPSRYPVPYLFHLAIVGALLAFVGFASLAMAQPLGLALVVFGLNALPVLPIVPEGDGDGGDLQLNEPGEYDGRPGIGFAPPTV